MFIIFFLVFFIKVLPIIMNILILNISISVKIFLVSILCFIIHILYVLPLRKRRKLSNLRAWKYRLTSSYPLNTSYDLFYNTLILSGFFMLTTFGIFWLRFSNIKKHIDILYIYYTLRYVISVNSIFINIINLLLIICIIIIYIQVFRFLKKYLKIQYTRRHIYECDVNKYWVINSNSILCRIINPSLEKKYNFLTLMYSFLVFFTMIKRQYRVFISSIFYILGLKVHIDDAYKRFPLRKRLYFFKLLPIERSILNLTSELAPHLQYIIILLALIYDILFNNLILETLFKILPFVFIYDLLIRLHKFIFTMDDFKDVLLHNFLYKETTEVFNEYNIGNLSGITVEQIQQAIEYAYADLYDKEKATLLGFENQTKTSLLNKSTFFYFWAFTIVIYFIIALVLIILYIYVQNFQ